MQSATQSLAVTLTLVGSPPPAGNCNVRSRSAVDPETAMLPVANVAIFGEAGTMSALQAATSLLS